VGPFRLEGPHFYYSIQMKHVIYVALTMVLVLGCKDGDPIVDEPLPKLSIQPLTVEEGDVNRPVFVDLRLDRAPVETVVASVSTQDGSARA